MTLANGPDFAVIRATEVIKNDFEFNLNNVITKIQEEIPQAGADGGGHEVAGSLKFVEGLQEEVLAMFIDEVKNLKR
jgi:RecJ-like exonuclease